MQNEDFVNGLINFIKNSPTPFHAVEIMVQILEQHGFKQLDESEQWAIKNTQQGERFYVTRNDSSIIAFQLNQSLIENGMRMVGAHTDSPCLKVKPNPEIINNNYLQLGVEVYGGALLNPWFDRDLSLAGRVSYLDEGGALLHLKADGVALEDDGVVKAVAKDDFYRHLIEIDPDLNQLSELERFQAVISSTP